jgi:hypothetical protein
LLIEFRNELQKQTRCGVGILPALLDSSVNSPKMGDAHSPLHSLRENNS